MTWKPDHQKTKLKLLHTSRDMTINTLHPQWLWLSHNFSQHPTQLWSFDPRPHTLRRTDETGPLRTSGARSTTPEFVHPGSFLWFFFFPPNFRMNQLWNGPSRTKDTNRAWTDRETKHDKALFPVRSCLRTEERGGVKGLQRHCVFETFRFYCSTVDVCSPGPKQTSPETN